MSETVINLVGYSPGIEATLHADLDTPESTVRAWVAVVEMENADGMVWLDTAGNVPVWQANGMLRYAEQMDMFDACTDDDD